MKWVTRKNASVDRIACPWLIKRFIDPDAQSLYVPAADVAAVAEREGALPYDVGGVELGHVDGRRSFESIILKYGLNDPALDRLARIVHGADVAADLNQTPEAAGLKAIAHGFAMVHAMRTTARSSWRALFTTRCTPGASTRSAKRNLSEPTLLMP